MPVRFRKPDARFLQEAHQRSRDLRLSYAPLGCSCHADAPPGFVVDNYRLKLGHGLHVFQAAKEALAHWQPLRLGWLEPCWPDTSIQEGALVGTRARALGLWWINVCRIVRVIDEDGPVRRYGFAHGTLVGHAECGEERFLVEWQSSDDSVWYEIRAVSKPGRWFTRWGRPLARRLQRRFGHDSLQAMANRICWENASPGRQNAPSALAAEESSGATA
jgi:uncharacterized protein (UPF0548 family)